MGALIKLVDAVLFLFFLIIAVFAPIFDAQTVLPGHFFPNFLIGLKKWYVREYDDYLMADEPDFFVGIIWLELLFQWPLAVANLYGIAASKPWFSTTCLVYGASCLTAMVAILAEMLGSQKASDKLLMMYYPFMGFAVLATLRGLVQQHSGKTTTIGKRPATNRKKRA